MCSKCRRQHAHQEVDHHKAVVAVDPGQDQVGARQFISLLSQAAPSTSMVFTGERDFEDCLHQFTTTTRLSAWQKATTDNRPYYCAPRLQGIALHFYTTPTVTPQQNIDQLVAAFCTAYTTNDEVLKAKRKAAQQ